MQLYSTKNTNHIVGLKEAVFKGLPPDNGLYMPTRIPTMGNEFFENIEKMSFQEVGTQAAHALIGDDISANDINNIVHKAIDFDAPAVHIHDNYYALELFHGPTLAFKDFGARFMANLMAYYLQNDSQKINILVATSGDTGGAVAAGFYGLPNINVTILYPSGKVSYLQEKQLTTLGKNITALEVQGTFDDCQHLVKQAFIDHDLSYKLGLSSANSINIARLIPQSFYYFWAYKQLKNLHLPIVFCTPSGNFGNIFAGIMAHKMGLPAHRYIAALNANNTFYEYIQTGTFAPKPSVATISNAMDVGNPSNFARIDNFFGNDLANVKKLMSSYTFSDSDTLATIKHVYHNHQYLLDPHGAVAYLGLQKYFAGDASKTLGVMLHTAHPAKFIDVYPNDMKAKIQIPNALAALADKPKKAVVIGKDYNFFKKTLLDIYP
ncbi:MAG: threonine synthase [Cytophagales bacterium]|nr:threonine synthase [Cytophagales bacterium]